MNVENVKQFLGELGVSKETLEALSAEKLPDDFKIKEAATKFFDKRKELTLNNSEVTKKIKEEANFNARVILDKQIKSAIKSNFGVSDEDINSMLADGQKFADVKELIKLASDKAKVAGNEGVEEVKKQLFDLRGKHDKIIEDHKTEIDSITNRFNSEKKNMLVKQYFSKEIGKLETILTSEAANKLLSTDLINLYDFDVVDNSLQVKTKEGSKVDDGKNFLTAEEVIKRRADELGILKKNTTNNTANNSTNTKPNVNVNPGENSSDKYKRMVERFSKK